MINFHKVNNHIYRGGSLTPKDVVRLKDIYKINRIITLDAGVARRIDRTTKLLGIEHIIIPIDMKHNIKLVKLLTRNIDKLLSDKKRVFIGCVAGKDRSGLAIALYRCKHDHWSCGAAIKEAKSYGFGIGVDPKIVHMYMKMIQKACGCKDKDVSFAYDIVSNERDYPSDYQDYTLGPWEQQSWSPYEDYRVREFPYADDYISWPEQYTNRIDYGLDDSDALKGYKNRSVPQSGQYDTSTSGINGTGPSLVGSGYI